MTNFPAISGKALVSALAKGGFKVIRTRGSHHFLRDDSGRSTVVPVHSGETISPGLLAKILKDCDLSREEFKKLL
ncbi:MAG: addiction module toxin, HicA family [Synergistaceae bacterium]|mgnify:CR=1 FL=1|nr:addiction module toxin, HicA family [Synergistaceae bacterium]